MHSDTTKIKPPDYYYYWEVYLASGMRIDERTKPQGFDPEKPESGIQIVRVQYVPKIMGIPLLKYDIPHGYFPIVHVRLIQELQSRGTCKNQAFILDPNFSDLNFIVGFYSPSGQFGKGYGYNPGKGMFRYWRHPRRIYGKIKVEEIINFYDPKHNLK